VKANRENGIALITALLVLMLISSIIVGFCWLVMTDQAEGGYTNRRETAFYGAEAGMEKLTADLNNLFSQNYAPSSAEVNAIAAFGNDPTIPGVQYIDPAIGTAGSGYEIGFPVDGNGNPLATNLTINSGPYQGMVGLVTPYTLTVISSSVAGSEVKLQRTVQTVGIPLFQFGIFSQTDLSFFAGPDFNFGGRVHTNGNLWLAEGGGTLTLGDKVTAVGEVIRTNLSNTWPTSNGYTGVVDILTAPGTYRAMAMTEGSLVGTLGSAANTGWQNISIGTYNGYVRDGDIDPPTYTGVNSTGATTLNITIATPQLGGTPVDLIRRPIAGELASAPGKLGERYFSAASLRILLSDNPADITGLPCETATNPIDLSLMTQKVSNWTDATITPVKTASSETGGAGSSLIPLAASGATGAAYSTTDGYWIPQNAPIIKGFIKIEAQTTYGVPCGTYKDVTAEILGLGYVGKNINSSTTYPTYGASVLPSLPGAQVATQVGAGTTCADPNPNAVIRLERVRDNPSTGTTDPCGTKNPQNLLPSDVWPNALFDPREGNPRDYCPDGTGGACNQSPTLGGVMYYVELDANNLARWFTGVIGTSGTSTKDPAASPNDFTVYFSDRRGNYNGFGAPASGWPPVSPSGNETGEYGWNDRINPGSQYGCPNNTLDTGEDFDTPQDATVQTYGALAAQAPYPAGPYPLTSSPTTYKVGQLYAALSNFGTFANASGAFAKNWQCGDPAYATYTCPVACTGAVPTIWPGWYIKNGQEARENTALFFRRALKIVNGGTLNLGTCPSGVNCGLSIASETPVYLQGDYNAPGGAFVAPYVAAAIVADSFTFLSDNWNDVNSFWSTYNTAGRNGTSTAYRVAIAAGKGISFPNPTAYTTYQDFGTDGGVHNFLRYVEGWNGTLSYRGSVISLYYNRQGSGVYKCCTTVYGPPTRGYNFDTDFLTPNLLPPHTPMFRAINTIGFTEYVLPN
jgi:hypothetical protein